MYEITCESCGKIGFHPSREGATSIATFHSEEMDHRCAVAELQEA